MEFLLGELFCGPGGLAYGAGLAGKHGVTSPSSHKTYTIRHLWGVDKDKDAIETYSKNVVKKFGGDGIADDALNFVQHMNARQTKINALAFGFPCNDFSLVGEQTGFAGAYGTLYQAGIAVIRKTNPLWFIAENVSGFSSADSGKAMRRVLTELQNAGDTGYNLTANLYKFEEYGIPQYRHRFIIVGIRKDQDLVFRVPRPTTPKPEQYQTVEQALEGLPEDAPNNEKQHMNPTIVQRLKLTPPWKNAWFLEELLKMSPPERRKILKSTEWYKDEFQRMEDGQIEQMIEDSMLHCRRAKMSHIYKRLQADRPSYTITGSGGGGTHVYHWKEHRSLTNRERARIQTFPDDFVFFGNSSSVRRQIGMAVPVEGARIIVEAILKTFAGVPYEAVEATYSVENTIPFREQALDLPSDEELKQTLFPRHRVRVAFENQSQMNIQVLTDGCRLSCSYQGKKEIFPIEAVLEAAALFRKESFVSEKTLALHKPTFFKDSKFAAFAAIVLLEKAGFGKREQPYRKSSVWVLKPLEKQG